MKKIKLYTIAAIASLLPLFSCEDFLDLNPTTQPSETTFWKTENDFNMALAGFTVRCVVTSILTSSLDYLMPFLTTCMQVIMKEVQVIYAVEI